jgi:site-specific DNA-methyltransferase (adenine-specific)
MSNNIFFERGQMADKPNNYLWNGDCLELMKDIPDKSIDAIICDLPYGTTACKWDSVIDLDLMWIEYNRVIKERGVIVLFGSEPFSSELRVSNLKDYKYDWIWDKNIASNFASAKYVPMKEHENISVFYKKHPTYNPQKIEKSEAGKKRAKYIDKPFELKEDNIYGTFGFIDKQKEHYRSPFFRYPRSIIKYNCERGLHPTQKPLELLKYLVKTYTNENDWVLDNTCGSNTTGIACYDLNRNYIGIEKDTDIYKVAKKRVEENILLRANEPKTLFEQ